MSWLQKIGIRKTITPVSAAAYRPQPAQQAPPAWTYQKDGLLTWHLADFLHDPRFQRAYAAGKATRSWGEADMEWRAYIVCWAAERALQLPGDFVECGVHRGGLARCIIEFLNFAVQPKRFYLLDTFCGFPPADRNRAADVHRQDYLDDCFADVQETFRTFANVQLIRGPIPETLEQVNSAQVCFLSIDMNCAEPEVAALAYFWPRLVSGAVVILDDYAYSEAYRRQKEALDALVKPWGVSILALPTGQGMLIKP